MYILIFIIGLIIGLILNTIIEKISYNIAKVNRKTVNVFVPAICAFSFEALFLRLGFTIVLVKALVMTVILIIISFIDLRHKVIPDFIVVIALIIGMIFSFVVKGSFIDTILGALVGGGIMLLLSLIPNAMGGGDIKFMFAIGAFLGVSKTLWAISLAFIISSVISIGLVLFKIKGIKDYIPFGPFLSLGSFISLLVFI